MSVAQYVVSVALLLCVVGSLCVSAVWIRQMLLPGWRSGPARVAEAVIGIGTLIVVAQLLGAVGLLKRAPLVLAYLVVLGGIGWVRRHRVPPAAEEMAAPRPQRAAVTGAFLVVLLALLPWSQHILGALHTGMGDYDTVSYHMPFAARFAQTGSITGIQYTGNPPVSFYPANSELVHAVAIVLFRRDVLSLVINLGWLGLALLSAWCIGRPAGLGPGTMSAVALLVSLSGMAGTQAGTAKNDMLGLALTLAAVALLVNGGWLSGVLGRRAAGARTAPGALRARGALVLAAIAGGLVVGTRLNLWITVLVLAAITIVAAGPRARRVTAGWWIAGLFVGGSFWYLRNLFATGNPLPWIDLRLGGLVHFRSAGAPADCGTRSVAHYVTDPGFITGHLVPQLATPFGARWWLPLGLMAIGLIAGVIQSAVPLARILALLGLVSVVTYLLTPATAGGDQGGCFAYNTRFAAEGIALGLLVVPLLLSRLGASPLVAIGAALIALVANAPLSASPRVVLMAVAILIAVWVLATHAWRLIPAPAVALLVVVLVGVALAGGLRETRAYLRERYQQPLLEEPLDSASLGLAGVSGARIGVTGADEVYPLYGPDLSNRVYNMAERVNGQPRFIYFNSCGSWVDALARGRYQYAVVANQGTEPAPQAAWTRRYPGARLLRASPPGMTRRGSRWEWEQFKLPSGASGSAASC